MSVWKNVKKTVTKTAKDAAKASGELVEQTKLKLKAVDLKDEIESRYTKIGELYYGVAEYDLDDGEKISALTDEIRELKEALEEVEAEIKRNKEILRCTECQAVNEKDDVYCRKCGNKLK